jgi:uncharacterized membrane protein YhiD involved in acid resistance
MKRQTTNLIFVFAIVLLISGMISYFLLGNRTTRPNNNLLNADRTSAVATESQNTESAPAVPQPSPHVDENDFFGQVFGVTDVTGQNGQPANLVTTFFKVTVRLFLAALLTAILAFRPRKFALLFKRNLFVAQTQILLAVVASALMMIVGDSAARAFGIFAAVSLVRFRTNIKDPKEITVLLVSLAVGLATGVGRWELAAILSLFVLVLLWALEYRESSMLSRAMELKVKTRKLVETYELVQSILAKYDFTSEIRTLNREDEKDPFGSVVLCVEVSPMVNLDKLSAEIFAGDKENIDSIEWSQQKNGSAYQ